MQTRNANRLSLRTTRSDLRNIWRLLTAVRLLPHRVFGFNSRHDLERQLLGFDDILGERGLLKLLAPAKTSRNSVA